VLKPAASNELRELRKDPAASGGEGKVRGGFGLKKEATYLSVAIGNSRETWDFLRTRIQEIILNP